MTATRQRSTAAITPGVVSRGTSPARANEDLPPPLGPMSKRKGAPRSAAPRHNSIRVCDFMVASEEHCGACFAPKTSRPRNGEPLTAIGQRAARPPAILSASH